MRTHVTVVPSDRLIIVDGTPLQFGFTAPANLHAVQWHEGRGEMEWTDDINHPLTPADYAEDVAPFVALWEAEKARIEEEAAAAEAARLAEYNSPEARAARDRGSDRFCRGRGFYIGREKPCVTHGCAENFTGIFSARFCIV